MGHDAQVSVKACEPLFIREKEPKLHIENIYENEKCVNKKGDYV